MTDQLSPGQETGIVAPEIVQVSVARVSVADVFKKAERQKALLTYLADSLLDGTQDAPTVVELASVLYRQYDADAGAKAALSDIRRLSVLLDNYYSGEGADDAVRIKLDPTNGHLHFELAEESVGGGEPGGDHPLGKRRIVQIAVVATLGAVLWILLSP